MMLRGIHHVTAVTGNASLNVGFYTEVLGMRLVKKTVNQDDVKAYHLFYGDSAGRPGTELTFFDWPRVGHAFRGTGAIGTTALRVSGTAALDAWARRLSSFRVAHDGIRESGGRAMLAFSDPEGQRLELVDDGGQPGGIPWEKSTVPPEMGIRGLHSIRIPVRQPELTARLLDVLGFRPSGEYGSRDGSTVLVFSVGTAAGPASYGSPGAEVHLEVRPDTPRGRVGIGGVHHAAFRTPSDAEQIEWRKILSEAGVGVTPVIDRFYFHSVYFREPGGVLFEIATDGPGFAVDEDPARLGEGLALPPFLEPSRAEIEAALTPIVPVKLTQAAA